MSEINKIASKFLSDYLRGKPVQAVQYVDVKKPTSCYGEDAEEFLNRMRKELEQQTAVQGLTERIDVDEPTSGTILMSGSQAFVGFLKSSSGKRRPIFTHDLGLGKVFTTEVDMSFAQIELLTFGIAAERRPAVVNGELY